MEKQVRWSDFQKATAEDYNTQAGFTRASLDRISKDGIEPGKAFSGFNVTESPPFTVIVAPGAMYNAGPVFFTEQAAEISFQQHLPIATRRIATIVVSGAPPEGQNARVEDREFLKDVVTRVTEARPHATENWRLASVSFELGNESASPTPKVIADNLLAIAYVTLDSTGVLSIQMIDLNRVKSVREVYNMAYLLGLEMDRWNARLETLEGDISRLANELRTKASQTYVNRVARDVARVKAKVDLPDDATDYGTDYFLDLLETDTGFAGYAAKIMEGLRFPNAASNGANGAPLTLANPTDDKFIEHDNGLILPVYTELRARPIRSNDGSVALNQFNYLTSSIVVSDMARHRVRFGAEFFVAQSSNWWGSGRWIDVERGIFEKAGEIFQALPTNQIDAVTGTVLYRVSKKWGDVSGSPYWNRTSPPAVGYGGYAWVQTLTISQDMWINSWGVNFPRLDVSGDVTFAICETRDDGTPDMNRVIGITTVPRAQLKLDTGGIINFRYPFPPTYLESGKVYGFAVITPGNHFVSVTTALDYADGTLFYRSVGNFWQNDPSHNFLIDFGICAFAHQRTVIEFTPVALAGGLASIDILADMVVPQSAKAEWEFRPVGSPNWYMFEPGGPNPFVGLPAQTSIRLTMQGTRANQVGINLTGSEVKVTRPAAAMRHVSATRTLAAASTAVETLTVIENFDEVKHDILPKLWTPAGGGTVYNPTATSDREDIPGIVERRASFTVPSTTSIRPITDGATTDVTELPVVSEVTYVAS